ncbi:MAG: TatD DNase family protein [Acidimicrobiia bacterium]|jgi:TatD DNase family protein|nr:TatD DNase family protein [Acidimicrobiia bacterium]
MRWFDHHCHLEPGPAAAAAVGDAAAAGVVRLLCVGTDEAQSLAAAGIAQDHPGVVWATAGCHPHEAQHGWSWVDAALDHPLVVAVGECGLDYHYDFSPRDVQRRAFAAQIALANRRSLPLIIHTREAWDDTFDILDREGVPARTVFHCFTGGVDEAQGCLARGAVLSFSGIASFPKAADVHEAVRHCPLDRLLVETDAPYLAPVPHRGKTNRPAWVVDVGAAVARLRGQAPEEIAAATWRTANQLYGLPVDQPGGPAQAPQASGSH